MNPASGSSDFLARPESRSPLVERPASLAYQGTFLGSDVTWQQGSLKVPLPFTTKLTKNLTLRHNLSYQLTEIDHNFQSFFPANLDLHRFSISSSLTYNLPSSSWSFFGNFSRDLSSDLTSINSDDLQISARLAAAYQFSNKFSLNFGISRNTNFGEARYLPSLGFKWTPNDQWALSLYGPFLTLSHRPTDNLIVRAQAFPSGGNWNIEQNDKSLDLGLRSYNVGVSLEYKLRNGLWLSAFAGTSLLNQLQIEDNGRTIAEENLNTGFTTRISLKLYEW